MKYASPKMIFKFLIYSLIIRKKSRRICQGFKKDLDRRDVEFKGPNYNIPSSKIGPKSVQKLYLPIYIGRFSPNTMKRIIENDLNR